MQISLTHDVVVVGARCAGAATAMLLARLGYDVALVDRAHFPSDTLSTHGISRGGVVQLKRWGLLGAVIASGAPPIRQVTFHTEAGELTRRIKQSAGVDHLLAPRRYVLDALLVEAATAAGAVLYTGTTVTGLLRGDDRRVHGVRTRESGGRETVITARLVVAADGVRSRLAREVGAATTTESMSGSGTFFAYFDGLAPDTFEFHVSERALAGVFPSSDEEACVWISSPAADSAGVRSAGADKTRALLAHLAAVAPHLWTRLRRSRATSGVRGAMNLPNIIRRPVGPGWALVGDAGYHRDPITGHGMTDAFRDAELLADAVDRWLGGEAAENEALEDYWRRRDSIIGPIFRLTCALTEFPGVERFIELQKDLSSAIEAEADLLATLPELTPTPALVAA
jgi:flavin-dependent dehydrogenase